VSGKNINKAREYFLEITETLNLLLTDNHINFEINEICNLAVNALKNGNKILIAGNGGSAADAQHFAGELVSRFYYDRKAMAAIALTTDTSILTAIGNDYGYEKIFSRQIEAIGRAGDIFIAISTSGNSKNLISAAIECKKMGISVVGLTGETGGDLFQHCDKSIRVPSKSTPRIQECHLMIEHVICANIEESMFPKT
jgi:D-sedoheptulose 7-phosphate isomerase